ncbi:MAG: type II toxin-antitoxin system HicB family antitoxin [Candidatus Rokuibacteriota bacterium]
MADFRIERLPDGSYLATSDSIQGLVAQGRTVSETVAIARDVAQKLLEARAERGEAAVPRAPSSSGEPDGRLGSLKEILDAAPLEGIDLTRRKDPPRDVAL